MEKLTVGLESEVFKCLTKIPGIGRKTATVLLAISQGMKEFEFVKRLIAVAYKLLKQCFSILKNKRVYVDNYEVKKCSAS
jgi:Holliday junction resolvasome RuvABC DNA-binding subunit